MEIVKRSHDMKGFVVLPHRRVVEPTFSWFGRNRRLAKDFENLGETLAIFVTLASIQLALRRLASVGLQKAWKAEIPNQGSGRRLCADSGRCPRGKNDELNPEPSLVRPLTGSEFDALKLREQAC